MGKEERAHASVFTSISFIYTSDPDGTFNKNKIIMAECNYHWAPQVWNNTCEQNHMEFAPAKLKHPSFTEF